MKVVKKSAKEKADDLQRKLEEKRKSFTEAEARKLVLDKFYDLARNAMYRYMNFQKAKIIGTFEKVWDKYKTSSGELTLQRDAAVRELEQYLTRLSYLK